MAFNILSLAPSSNGCFKKHIVYRIQPKNEKTFRTVLISMETRPHQIVSLCRGESSGLVSRKDQQQRHIFMRSSFEEIALTKSPNIKRSGNRIVVPEINHFWTAVDRCGMLCHLKNTKFFQLCKIFAPSNVVFTLEI